MRPDSAIAPRRADGYDETLIDLGGADRAEGNPVTPEIYTIVAVGIALAGLILNGQRSIAELRKDLQELRKDLNALGERVNRDIAAIDEKLSHRITALDEKLSHRITALDEKLSRGIAALGERIARLEGFMEGIRDAIAGKAA